jgi:RNA polymerase sigma factor (sigma-70 family)
MTSRPHEEDLRTFVIDCRGELVAIAYVLTGCRETAQDAVHDVITRLLSTNQIEVENVPAYVRRAVTNECLSSHRRAARHGRRAQALRAECQRHLNTQPDPYGRIEVLSALSSLSAKQRSAVVLRYYLHVTDAEIGDALGCAPSTVRSLLSRSLRKLREDLTNGDNNDGRA